MKAALLGVFPDDDQRAVAKETLECDSVFELFSQFTNRDLGWVIRCDVTDSMVSSRWGLRAFVLKGRGYIYYFPDDDCTEWAAELPILAAWEPVKSVIAYKASLLKAYIRNWKEALLPPYVGQWAEGPFDAMVEAVSEILAREPDNWPEVLRQLGQQKGNSSLTTLAEKTSLKLGLHPKEVEEIIGRNTSATLWPASEDLSGNRIHVLVGAFLVLIDQSSFISVRSKKHRKRRD